MLHTAALKCQRIHTETALDEFVLLRSSMQAGVTETTNSFTQEDLNQGLIIYHQQAAGRTNDSVLLEATNGVTKVGPIRLEIDIIPILLPLQVQNVCLYVMSCYDLDKGIKKREIN